MLKWRQEHNSLKTRAKRFRPIPAWCTGCLNHDWTIWYGWKWDNMISCKGPYWNILDVVGLRKNGQYFQGFLLLPVWIWSYFLLVGLPARAADKTRFDYVESHHLTGSLSRVDWIKWNWVTGTKFRVDRPFSSTFLQIQISKGKKRGKKFGWNRRDPMRKITSQPRSQVWK